MAVFFLASAACGLAPHGDPGQPWLIAARALQGVGAALMMPVSAVVVMAAFGVAERGKAMAIYAGISQLFLAVGPLVGGVLTQSLSWRAVFWLNVPVGLAALLLVHLARPADVRRADAGPAQRRANRLRDLVRELLTRRGADLRYGRTLPRALREAGLVEVAAAGSFPVGGLACDRLEAATIRHVRGELLAAGLADDVEIDAHLAAIHAGKLDLTLAPLISAWGRRQAEHPPTLG